MEKSKKNKLRFAYFIYLLICALTFLYVGKYLDLPGFVLPALVIILVFMLDKSHTFSALLSLQMLDTVILVTLGSSAVSFLFIALPLVIIRDYMIRPNKLAIPAAFIPVIGLISIEIFNSLDYSIHGFGTMINWVLGLLYFCFLCKDKDFKIDINKTVFFFALALITVCLINMDNFPPHWGNGYNLSAYSSSFRLGDQYRRLGGPNTISLNSILVIALSTLSLLKTKEWLNRVIPILAICCGLLFGVLTFSRAFLFELILFILIVVFSHNSVKSWHKMLIIVACLSFAVYIFSSNMFVGVIESFTDRLQVGNTNRISLLWEGVNEIFASFRSLMIGRGILYPYVPSLNFTVHNLFIDSFIALGLCALVYWGVIVNNIKSVIKAQNERISLFHAAPFILWAINTVFIGSIRDVNNYLFLFLLFMIMCGRVSTRADSPIQIPNQAEELQVEEAEVNADV